MKKMMRDEDERRRLTCGRSSRHKLAVALVAVALFAGACGASSSDTATDASEDGSESTSSPAAGGTKDEGFSEVDAKDASGDAASEAPASERDLASDGEASATEEASDVSEGALDVAPESDPPERKAKIARQAQEDPLRAGSVDDNDRWDEYLDYRANFSATGIEVSDLSVEGRRVIRVLDEHDKPVLGARVTMADSQGNKLTALRTYADGVVQFFPSAVHNRNGNVQGQDDGNSFEGTVEKDGVTTTFTIDEQTITKDVTLDLGQRSQGPVKLDLHFLIDATGSMADEIDQLKVNMISVAQKLDTLPQKPDIRYSVTSYRDFGDEYVTRSSDFTDLDAFVADFQQISAEGGGDKPEALNEGLHEALTLPSWRVDDTVSIVVLVGDAPPHLDYDNGPDYADDLLTAQGLGIKIFPIASSGIDDQGEYVFRQFAQATMGRFVFLTYGADGVSPGDSTEHHVDDYSVLALDDLVVRLVSEELSLLTA